MARIGKILVTPTTNPYPPGGRRGEGNIEWMRSVCGTYWKSRALSIAILIGDLVCLFGGTPDVPILGELYWLRLASGEGLALWNSRLRQSLEALGILWMLRILTLGRAVLAWAFFKYLLDFHSLPHSHSSQGRRRLVSLRLILLSVWHLLAGAGQMVIFWSAYLPVILGVPEGCVCGVRGATKWMASLVRDKIVGPAPLIILLTLHLEVMAIVMTLLYRSRKDGLPKVEAHTVQSLASV